MDKLAAQIIEHSREVSENNPVPESIDEMKKRIADSLITSYGAKDAEPVKIMSKALLPSSGRLNSPIYFTRNSASVDISSLINGTMTRYLDYNDTYLSKEALHPSDNIPPMLALGYSKDMTGMDVIKSSMVAYDIAAGFSDACSIRDRGWDHVTYISISSAAGLSTLLDLDERKFEHCLNLAINNNISMRQTRTGELSMWKGATAANACRNSVMAAELASEGFTGPSPIFSGEMGFFRQVSGEIFPVFKSNSVLRTMIKNYPVEYHAMSAAEVAVELKGRIEGDIESIEIETFRVAHQIIIKDPEKWRPKTRETADHSMPYIIAYALRYGAPNPDSYSEKYLNDPGILALMGKMHFKVTERFNAMYPEYLPVKISVKTSKQKIEKELDVPKGHFKRPYTWDDLMDKGTRVMGEDNSRSLMEIAKSFDRRDVKEIFEVVNNVTAKR